MNQFVHLHNHSHYSLLDGTAFIGSIIQTAAEYKMPAVALTDHGVLFGTMEFYKKAKKANIKPIIGCEAYIVSRGSRRDRVAQPENVTKAKGRGVYNHILLLARDEQGYRNLMKLSTLGHIEGFYYKPRIDVELLSQYSKGLIVTTACPGGVISPYLLAGDYEEAKNIAGIYKEIFSDDFYIEVQNHRTEIDNAILKEAPRIAKQLGVKLVATNDCHYIKPEHSLYHNIMLNIPDARNGGVIDYRSLRYGTDQLYFKTTTEMISLFKELPEAINSTLEITEKCNLEFGKQNYMPEFPIPQDSGVATLDELLGKFAREGVEKRYGVLTQELKSRMEYELSVIKKMGYAGYFLIVQDFINAARQLGVRVGPGRGSAAGSIVSYGLGITEVDPLKYGLLFERFLNPDRISMPDIDVDFADDKRDKVIEYVKQKYGKDSVAQIVTFGTLSSRAVLKDVGRVVGIPHTITDSITKNIPVELGKPKPLAEALDTIPEMKTLKNSHDDKIRLMIETSLELEGLNRNVSTHAAGIVIAPGKIDDFVPLYQSPNTDLMTQFNMKDLEDAGLLKIDFLGLRTLTVIENALELIKKNHNIEIDFSKIPENDETTLDLFCKGQTVAIFQFESPGMQDYLRKLKPSSIDDLVAMNALYRPGPMNMIDEFITCKYGQRKTQFLHPKLVPILKETYGVIVYQEQVMRIASEIAGFSLAKADLMRRAMGKKDKNLMAGQKKEFVDGAIRNGIDKRTAAEIFDLIDKFASYGFNKSHSVAYSVLAYQTAYLKARFPAEYMAATLTSEMADTDKIVLLIDECRKLGIPVLPPDVNEGDVGFKVTPKGIRFGLSAIKNVGIPAVEQIVGSRMAKGNFIDIFDFCSRVDLRLTNKKTIESLILAGAFDSLHSNRTQLFASVERAILFGQYAQDAAIRGQENLFDAKGAKVQAKPTLINIEEWPLNDKLSREKSVLGFFITGHPLRKYELEIQSFSTARFGLTEGIKNSSSVKICGIITSVKKKIDKKGNAMAFITLEDFTGKGECIVFSDAYRKYSNLLFEDSMVLIEGKADKGGETLKVLVSEVVPMEAVRSKYTRNVTFVFNLDSMMDISIFKLRSILDNNPGKSRCQVIISSGSLKNNWVYSIPKYDINLSDSCLEEIRSIPGFQSIKLEG